MNQAQTDHIRENLAQITTAIANAAAAANMPHKVELIAVSKQQLDERIDAALEAGQRVFGENRVQEAMERWAHRRADYPDLQLHLIGPLQTNKAADAIALFDVIEVLDRDKLASVLAKEMQRQNRHLPCLVQVNTGEEDQKSGIMPSDAVAFAQHCRDHHGLNVTGMMCIPPVDEEPAMHFALLAKLAKEAGLTTLSMGMSSDYLEAIKFGATSVRVGSAIFGERLPRQ